MADRGAIATGSSGTGGGIGRAAGTGFVAAPSALFPTVTVADRLPDAERLVTTYLRNVPAISAYVGSRVTTELPSAPVYPAVTVARVGGVPSLAGYLDEATLDIACWGTTKVQAEELARTVEAAMLIIVGTYALGVVTDSRQMGIGLRWDVDEATDRPRYLMTWSLYVHP